MTEMRAGTMTTTVETKLCGTVKEIRCGTREKLEPSLT